MTSVLLEDKKTYPKNYQRRKNEPDSYPTSPVVNRLLTSIKRLDRAGRRFCRTRYDHDKDKDLWITGGYNNSPEWIVAKNELEELGYEVTFVYEPNSYVDMYTRIDW